MALFFVGWSKAQTHDDFLHHGPVFRRSRSPRSMDVAWTPPPNGVFKLNFDGSKLLDGRVAIGFVIRDHLGSLVLAGALALSSRCSILSAEAWGLREGIKGVRFLNASSLIIEGDNLVVVNSLRRCWNVLKMDGFWARFFPPRSGPI